MREELEMENYQWMNESSISVNGDEISIFASGHSDFFESKCDAPFYYTEVAGDFVLRTKVSVDFRDTFDSACIMVMKDLKTWAKACFEQTDFGTRAVVSVVTIEGSSDDANGCNIDGDAVWLQMVRVGQSFGLHYSLDGVRFDMMRTFRLPVEETVKVGLLAQAPTGDGGERRFANVAIEKRTVENLRKGE